MKHSGKFSLYCFTLRETWTFKSWSSFTWLWVDLFLGWNIEESLFYPPPRAVLLPISALWKWQQWSNLFRFSQPSFFPVNYFLTSFFLWQSIPLLLKSHFLLSLSIAYSLATILLPLVCELTLSSWLITPYYTPTNLLL